MEADFSGWATKSGIQCSDGRTILPDAFKEQDKTKVPLVWQHGHKDPENVLGHCLLENRPEGVYAYGFFNKSAKAAHAQELVSHKDISMMSIWANELVERSKKLIHGVIREVSLVLSGANPGALIEQIAIRHSDDPTDVTVLDDEARIFTGLEFEHGFESEGSDHIDNKDVSHANGGDASIQDVIDTLDEEQLTAVHYLVGEALAAGKTNVQQDSMTNSGNANASNPNADKTIQDVIDTFTEEQLTVVQYLVGEALASVQTNVQQDNMNGSGDSNDDEDNNDDTKGSSMKHNVFEDKDDQGKPAKPVLSHEQKAGIFADAMKLGSLKDAVEAAAIQHGIEDIDVLFPEAQIVGDMPELFGRRVEWVNNLLSATTKRPFSRIKTLSADITEDSARAKGYIKGNLKKEEFFRTAKRVTTPTTVYKKQKLDRDDLLDITEFDTVAWLKGEMRLMLDEELARAILVGDGRDPADDDKIDEERIRPIATDHELYTTVVNLNATAINSSLNALSDAITINRAALRGSGMPTFYTTETYIAKAMTLRDSLGRKIYRTLEEWAQEIRVQEIVPVEVLEEYPNIIGVLVNPVDYVLGANKGGQVSMFDDFDIDYNQYKYLIETRCCGALVKLKSAMVFKLVASDQVLVVPASPSFDGDAITIVNQTGVVYRNAATNAVMNAGGSPYAVADDVTVTVNAEPASGYYFATSDDDTWSFTGTP